MSEEFEFERSATRDEASALLRGLADGIAAGSIRLDDGDRAVAAAVADDLELEVEFEADDGELDLEVELEWEDPGTEPGSAADESGAERDVGETPGDTGEEAGDEEGTDPDAEEGLAGTELVADAEEAVADPEPVGDAGEAAVPGIEQVGPVEPPESLGRFELFTDRAGEWRWRLVHRNGNVIATSGEGYTRKHNAVKGLRSVKGNAPGAAVVEESGE